MSQGEEISAESIYELADWLTVDKCYSQEQLEHLKDEEHYLPLIALAHNFWLVGALVQQLKNKKVWNSLPEELANYLDEIERLYLSRSKSITKEAQNTCKILEQRGINVIMLKGVAALFNGSYNEISERYMVDIDLLVREEDAKESFLALKEHGYSEQPYEFDIQIPNHHHLPALIRNNGCCFIEVHKNALKSSVAGVLSTHEIWRDSIPLPFYENASINQLNPTHQLILAIAHSELSDNNYKNNTFELKQIHHAYVISRYYYDEIDWEKVQGHFVREGLLHVLESMMFNIQTLFDFGTPIAKRVTLNSQTHLEKIIRQYVQCQGVQTFKVKVKQVLQGYDRQSILYLYGYSGYFPVFKGRLNHLKRHCKIFIHSLRSRLQFRK